MKLVRYHEPGGGSQVGVLEGDHVVPLVGRRIPVIADDYVDPEFGSGCLKITPAHDFNDYAVGARHDLPLVNISVAQDSSSGNKTLLESLRIRISAGEAWCLNVGRRQTRVGHVRQSRHWSMAWASFRVCSSSRRASMMPSISPSNACDRLWMVSPMRWSVILLWGKL